MNHPYQAKFVFLLLSLSAAPIARANDWQVCRMRVEITGVLQKPYAQLQARVLQLSAKPAAAACPAVGDTITFAPERADYQSMLPRKLWPKVRQTVNMRYQYLDGICKREMTGDTPCRIKHYPLDDL